MFFSHRHQAWWTLIQIKSKWRHRASTSLAKRSAMATAAGAWNAKTMAPESIRSWDSKVGCAGSPYQTPKVFGAMSPPKQKQKTNLYGLRLDSCSFPRSYRPMCWTIQPCLIFHPPKRFTKNVLFYSSYIQGARNCATMDVCKLVLMARRKLLLTMAININGFRPCWSHSLPSNGFTKSSTTAAAADMAPGCSRQAIGIFEHILCYIKVWIRSMRA